jgi:putative membrane protein
MTETDTDEPDEIDYRFSLANERTFLAWYRTAFALVVGGVAGAKALEFNHDVWRWVISGPPIVAGALLALDARARWRRYEDAMRTRRPLPAGRGIGFVGTALAVYAIVALLVVLLDG